ncbi:surface-associated interspersed protein 1.2, putative [Plasmodium sp.]|nr:surface-associated interspersed protein 1.2, putative [Plasmodium sp.]
MHFVVEFQDWIQEPKDESISSDVFKRNFESKVESDLEELEKLNVDDYSQKCRLLNNLIDNIRELFFTSNNIKIPHGLRTYLWDNQIEGNLKTLISNTTKDKCERKRFNNPQKDRDLRLKLHNYCDERDKRLSILQGKGNNEDNCYEFMMWVNKNKESITRDYRNNMSGVRNRGGFFKISNTCDLNKFNDLFPHMDCSSKIYGKDEVLREPKEMLEIHQGGDQNTVGEGNQLKSKEKKDKEKEKHKEKGPYGVTEEIYGVGRDSSEKFVPRKILVDEEEVSEYTTNDCAGGKCIVMNCNKDNCNLIAVSSDDEEPEKENVPNSFVSSSTNKGGSLQSEKKKEQEDSSPNECEGKQCTEEHKKKREYQETDQVGTTPLDHSKKNTKGPVKGHSKHQRTNGKGSRDSTNEGTYSSGSSNSGRKSGKKRSQRPKKISESGDDGNRKENILRDKHGNVISHAEAKKKRRKGSTSVEGIPHMHNGDHNIKGKKEVEDEVSSNKQKSDEFESDPDALDNVEGTIESNDNDDGQVSIFGIPLPNFSDYTDFDLSDLSLSNIPYPNIHLPFFPRSPRIYKGLYGGIRRIPPGPTHINIHTREAVDIASEMVNKVRDKADSEEQGSEKPERSKDEMKCGDGKNTRKPDTCSDVGCDGPNRPSEQENVNRREEDKKDKCERAKESKDSKERHINRGEDNIRSSNPSDISTEHSSKTSYRETQDNDVYKDNESPCISEPRGESDENNASNNFNLGTSTEGKDNMVLTSSRCTRLTNDDNYGTGCTTMNNVNSSDSEENTIKTHVSGHGRCNTFHRVNSSSRNNCIIASTPNDDHISGEGENLPLGTKNTQDLSNGLGEDHEQPVTADINDPSFISLSTVQEEEVPIPQDGTMCEGVLYTGDGSPCTQSSNYIGINSTQRSPSYNGDHLSNEIPSIRRVSRVWGPQSLNSHSEAIMSQVLRSNLVELSTSSIQGTIVGEQQHHSLGQMMNVLTGPGQSSSQSQQQQGKETTSEGRARRSTEDTFPKEVSITTAKGLKDGTLIINKTYQNSSSFFDFSSLTKNISIALAIFGVIFLFIFSNRHSSLGMFNKKKKKRRRKSVLIKEDNMNAVMLEKYEDIDEEQNEKRKIYEEEHEDDDKVDEDDCNDNELNRGGVILPYEKEEDDIYKIEDQLEWVANEKIEKEESEYINVEHTSDKQTYDYNNIHDGEDIKSVDVKRIIKEKKERWKWKNIIEIQMVVIEEIHNEEWKMNKEDFLSICINEFMNEKNRKCLYNEDDDINNIEVMIKGQSFLWNKWMERHKYMLDKWKEEESFEYLKNEWKREEDEYMKKIHKDLLVSLRGDTYNMSQRQKIIWRRWIAKHPYRIREKTIDQWFDKLFEELNKNNIISDDIIDILLNDYVENDEKDEYIYDMSEKRKKLKLILWIQIYMCVLEEAQKDNCIKKKETYINTFIENIKDKEYIIDVVENIKKDIHKFPLNKSSCKWKKEKWFEELKNVWKVEENKRLYSISLKNRNDIYKELMKKSTIYIEKNILHKLWDDINFKWIDEENEKDWLKVTANNSKDENNIIYINKNTNIYINKNIKKEENKMKCSEIKYMFGNMSLQGRKEDYHEHNFLEAHKGDDTSNIFNNEFNEEDIDQTTDEINQKNVEINQKTDEINQKNDEINQKTDEINQKNDGIHIVLNQHYNEWIQVIKLHLHLIDECKKEEWEKNKYNFLEICIEEYIKNENKDNNRRNILEDEIFNMDKNMMWDTFIETHRYILEKWKREEWFHSLKNEWKVEVLNYLNSSENRNDERDKNCNEEKRISLIEKEKNIFRKWIHKHTEEFKDCYEDEKNPFLEEDVKKKKKHYKLIAWIQIHMMILERLKEDECLSNQQLFIDICIEVIKKGHLCKNNVIIIEMLNKLKIDIYNSSEYLLLQENDDKKKKEWYKKLKKYWMDKGSIYFNFLGERDNDETIYHIIKQSMISVYNNMFIKNYDDEKFQWIDEDNEKDWLKFVNVNTSKTFSDNICGNKHLKDIKKDVQNEMFFLSSDNKTIMEKQQVNDIDISKSELPMCNKILIENKMSILRDIYKTKEMLTFYSEEM